MPSARRLRDQHRGAHHGKEVSFELAPDVPGQVLQFDEISPKFIAMNGLFRLEDRAVANDRDAVLKSAKRQISARILRKRCPLPT